MHFTQVGYSLLLLILANGTPVLVADIFKQRWDSPMDFGYRFFDGRPIFGKSKTWRGFIAAILATPLIAVLIGLDWYLGVLFASLAMCGDLLASFCKRRIGIKESGRAWLLDQIPESLLPLFVMHDMLDLSMWEIIFVVILFSLLDILISPVLYKLHIRKKPY